MYPGKTKIGAHLRTPTINLILSDATPAFLTKFVVFSAYKILLFFTFKWNCYCEKICLSQKIKGFVPTILPKVLFIVLPRYYISLMGVTQNLIFITSYYIYSKLFIDFTFKLMCLLKVTFF